MVMLSVLRTPWMRLFGLAVGLALQAGFMAYAISPEASAIIRQNPQVLNMGGYVLGGETNMNTQYARKFNYGLLKDAKQWDEGPVIIMEKPEIQQERFLLNMPRHWPSQTDGTLPEK
jgi:hypothetical protein